MMDRRRLHRWGGAPRARLERRGTLFHLAAVPGGAAERDPALARQVNLDGSLDLLEAVAASRYRPRVVFASSIAVFGPPMAHKVDDTTSPFPTMLYGAQKRMVEIAIEQMTAASRIDGISLRLPGLVARADVDFRLRSAFLSALFGAFATGGSVTLPVSRAGTTRLLSRDACVDALLHATALSGSLDHRERTLTPPALRVSMSELVEALERAVPTSGASVVDEPDARSRRNSPRIHRSIRSSRTASASATTAPSKRWSAERGRSSGGPKRPPAGAAWRP